MTTTEDPKALLPDVMAKVANLGPSSLTAVHRFLQKIELGALMEDIQDDAESLRDADKLDADVLQAAITEHRSHHPYR